jgi:hypothetical protein
VVFKFIHIIIIIIAEETEEIEERTVGPIDVVVMMDLRMTAMNPGVNETIRVVCGVEEMIGVHMMKEMIVEDTGVKGNV